MKKALSIVLSVAMLMTAMFIVPTSAELPDEVNFLDSAMIAEGAENVTVNEDGSWTITGTVALAPHVTFDYTVHQFITLDMTTDTPLKITILDRDPLAEDDNPDDNGYGEHWIGLYDNWEGPSHFPVGDYNATNSIQGIYNWNVQYSGWGNAGYATARAIYLEFDGGVGEATIRKFNLNNGNVTNLFDAEPEFETTETFDLAVKDVDMWEQIPVSGSRVNVVADEEAGTLTLGNTAGAYPSVYIDFPESIIMEPETAMIYADFKVMKDAKTTMYLFFGDCDANNFDSGAYAVIHQQYSDAANEIGAASYKGYISIADILPTDPDALAACYDENGNLKLNSIKMYATSTVDGAVDPALVINSLDLLYNEAVVEPDFILGDVNEDGEVDMRDAFSVYNAASSGNVSDNVAAYADMNEDGEIDMRDAFAVYRIASGA